MKVRFITFVLGMLLATALLLPLAASALEPPRPGELAKYKRDGTLTARLAFAKKLGNYKLAPGLARAAVYKVQGAQLGLGATQFAPPPNWRGMPTTGTVKMLVVCVDFSDYPHVSSQAQVQSACFGTGVSTNYPYESLRQYYLRASYNQLGLQGTVLPWYRPAYTRSSMAQTQGSREALIKAALQANDATVDYSQFDNDNDGKIDYFAVLWTGPDNGWANFWWGYQTWWGATAATFDGVTPQKYSWQPETWYQGGVPQGIFWPRVLIHETGHALGLPDLYDYQSKAQGDTVGPDGGAGAYDMMDSNEGDMNAFYKWLLDWTAPQTVSWVTRTITLKPSCTDAAGSSIVVMPGFAGSPTGQEFFIIQNRNKVYDSNDRYMPGSHGLLIWHVDATLNDTGQDFKYNNSYTAHKMLRLQEADGLEEIENGEAGTGYHFMDAADYYVAGGQFGNAGTPNSDLYGGADTGIVVDTISELVRDVTFRVVGGFDHTPPTSSITPPDGTWHDSPVTLTLSATDSGGSGLNHAEYNLDGAGWVTGGDVYIAAPSNHSNDGLHTIEYRAVDGAENWETIRHIQVGIDTQAPVTTVIGNSDAWTAWHVNLIFSSTDTGGSDMMRTEYSVDGGTWMTGVNLQYAAEADHSHDGAHVVRYRGTDRAGNVESPLSCQLNMDTEGPATSDDSGGVWHRTPYTVTVTATDPLSGVGVVYLAAGGGELKPRTQVTFYRRPHKMGNGRHQIYYFALDQLNNYGPSHIADVLIDDEVPVTTTNFTSGAIKYGAFTVVLTPHDKYSGVPSANVHHRVRLNGGAWSVWTTGTSMTVPAPPTGQYAGDIQFYSVDRAGNTELTQTVSLTVRPALGVRGLRAGV